jgi:hypothetical protein
MTTNMTELAGQIVECLSTFAEAGKSEIDTHPDMGIWSKQIGKNPPIRIMVADVHKAIKALEAAKKIQTYFEKT